MKIADDNTANLGRGDEINIFNGTTLADRLTYGDQTFTNPPTIRTVGVSGIPTSCLGLGANRAETTVPQLVDRFRGEVVSRGADEICAMFDGPGRAVRCAAARVANGRREGWEARAGVHSGECELTTGSGVEGVALQIARAIAATARPGDVLASQTVRDVVVGTTITFEPRGVLCLDGVAGNWHVLEVTRT